MNSVQFSCSVMSDSLQPHESQHAGKHPVHHQLPEFTQTHVHRVSDAIQPSHPLSSPSSPAPNPSQHQSLFQWVNSLYWSLNETISVKYLVQSLQVSVNIIYSHLHLLFYSLFPVPLALVLCLICYYVFPGWMNFIDSLHTILTRLMFPFFNSKVKVYV